MAEKTMGLFDHPGFMAYDGGLIEVLHADWPCYPSGHGWALALRALAVFPGNARFVQIDDIDRCRLFVVVGHGAGPDPHGNMFDPRWFHVAAWEEDVLELHNRGYSAGTRTRDPYREALDFYEQHKNLHVRTPLGRVPMDLPPPQPKDYEDELPALKIVDVGMSITALGMVEFERGARPLDELDTRVASRVGPLLDIERYDTAVRDAAVILETRLRDISASSDRGPNLVDHYIRVLLVANGGIASAFIKVLHGELRTIFKFIRNPFAHSLHDLSRVQCSALLDRISGALEAIERIEGTRQSSRAPRTE